MFSGSGDLAEYDIDGQRFSDGRDARSSVCAGATGLPTDEGAHAQEDLHCWGPGPVSPLHIRQEGLPVLRRQSQLHRRAVSTPAHL